jgi:hypothetical protein
MSLSNQNPKRKKELNVYLSFFQYSKKKLLIFNDWVDYTAVMLKKLQKIGSFEVSKKKTSVIE